MNIMLCMWTLILSGFSSYKERISAHYKSYAVNTVDGPSQKEKAMIFILFIYLLKKKNSVEINLVINETELSNWHG